jgi:type II secretory pathway pseudopilin PulG
VDTRTRSHHGRGSHMCRSLIGDAGVSVAEVLLVLAIVSISGAMSIPICTQAIDAGRARAAAGFVAARFRLAGQQAVAIGRSVAVVFDETPDGWTFRVCHDRNGNGVRRADIASLIDRCPEGPLDTRRVFGGVTIDVSPGVPGPDGDPPPPDPVQAGASDMLSFSRDGGGSSGTVFLLSPQGVLMAVRVVGASGRVRVLRYDRPSGVWVRG